MPCVKNHRETPIYRVLFQRMLLCCGVVAAAFAAPASHADDLDEERAALETVKRDDLDAHFSYAKNAMKERDAREAEWALREMLKKNPNLDRVRLELALVLVPQGKYHEAAALLNEVLEKNPPAPVKKNIERVMEVVDTALEPHRVGGGFSIGFNRDTNGNASPSSGDITILDTSIPLGNGAGRVSDQQTFLAVNVSHVYRTDIEDDDVTLRWKTDFLEYRTKQATLSNLDLALHSLRTGPEISWLDAGVKLGLYAGYNIYELNHYTYMRNPKGEYALDFQLSPSWVLQFNGIYEYRGFQNAPNVNTYESRQGQAWQQGVGLRYIAASDWILNGNMYIRQEDATADYFENRQFGANAGVTHLFSKDVFASLRGGYRSFNYQDNDPLISVQVRDDEEFSGGLTFGRNFLLPETKQNVTLTGGYQYRDVHSNIQNYAYDNHRVTMSLGMSF